MKKSLKVKNNKLVIFLMVAVLIVGLATCCFLVFYIPTSGSRKTAVSKVKELGENFNRYGIRSVDTGSVRTLMLDTDGNVIGYYINTDIKSFSPDEWPESWYLDNGKKYLSQILSGNEIAVTRLTKGSGFNIYVYTVSGAPLYENGKIIGAVYMFKRDSTVTTAIILFMIIFFIAWVIIFINYMYRKQQEKRAAELEFVKQQYVANIAHSLKTPITIVKGLAEAIRDGVVTDPDKKNMYLDQITDECTYQVKTVNDILKLSELQSNGRDFTKEEVLADECFEKVIARFSEICENKGLKFKVSDDFYNLPVLYTKAEYIAEVAEIILENAVKFTDEGAVFMRSFVHEKSAIICICDNGPGISRRDINLIFERFYKGKDIKNINGSGLGLAIAKEIMNGLNEKIWAESPDSGGAEFKFTISLK